MARLLAKLARRIVLPGALCAAVALMPARGPFWAATGRSDSESRGGGAVWAHRESFWLRTETFSGWLANRPVAARGSGIMICGGCFERGMSAEDAAGDDAFSSVPAGDSPPDARDFVVVRSGMPLRWLEASLSRDRTGESWSPWSTSWGIPLGPQSSSPSEAPLVVPLGVRPLALVASLAAWIALVELVRFSAAAASELAKNSRGRCRQCRYPVDPRLGCPECGLGRSHPPPSA